MAVDVLITVKNLQKQSGQKHIISYQTRGYLYPKNQATFLQYQEESEGLEGVTTTLKLEKDRVTLIRHGNISMCQTFQNGFKDEGNYETPYGAILMAVDTVKVEMAIGKEEGVIRIFYDLYLDEELSSSNTLEVSYEMLNMVWERG